MTISQREQRYQEYFETPIGTLQAEHDLFSNATGDGGRWHGFATDIPGVSYRIAFLLGEQPAVRIVIDRSDHEWNRWLFDRLFEFREAIQAEIPDPLVWDYVEGRRRCIVSVIRDGSIADPRETWPEMQTWMVDRLLAFKRVFTPHLQELVE